jgi:hypothetical protein
MNLKVKKPAIKSLAFHYLHHRLKMLAPNKIAITNSARKTKNRTLAMSAAPSAIPPNPNIAAMIAMIKKITDQRNIVL